MSPYWSGVVYRLNDSETIDVTLISLSLFFCRCNDSNSLIYFTAPLFILKSFNSEVWLTISVCSFPVTFFLSGGIFFTSVLSHSRCLSICPLSVSLLVHPVMFLSRRGSSDNTVGPHCGVRIKLEMLQLRAFDHSTSSEQKNIMRSTVNTVTV